MAVIDPRRYSDLVGAIYDCALDPARWEETLLRLCAELGMATSAATLHALPAHRVLISVTTGMTPADIAAQTAYSADVFALWGGPDALTRPIDRTWVLSRLYPQDQLDLIPIVREWAEPRGLIDCVAMVVSREPGLVGAVAMGRHRDAGPIDDAALARIELFRPHVQRAARITGLLDARTVALRNVEAVIAAIAAPVILVRGDLSVVLGNPSAEGFFQAGEVLRLAQGRLASPVPGLAAALQRLVARIAADEAAIDGHELGLPVRTRAGALYTLHILPLTRRPAPLPPGEAAVAAIFVSSTAIVPVPAPGVLGALFELTAAEQRVFERIAAGYTTQETAAALGVAPTTVRTHLLRIFDKIGVNRQADLIRMAYALTAPTTGLP